MRTIAVYVLIPVVTVVYSLAATAHMLLFRDKQVFYIYARSWSRLLLSLAGVSVTVQRKTTNDRSILRPCVYAANHASLFDIPVLLAYLPDNVRIMYKKELERIPVFGWCIRVSPYIAVDRTRAREASQAIEHTAKHISEGASVLVFPEGTRSATGSLGSFKRGFVTFAQKAGVPMTPVALIGTSQIMPARTYRVRGGKVTMVVFPSVRIDAGASRSEEQDVVNQVRATIEQELEGR